MGNTIVVALGGNAIIAKGQKGTIYEEFANTRTSLDGIVQLIKEGYNVAITHGNGPQAGTMLLRVEAGIQKGIVDRPLGVIVADTEGGMGYMIEQSLDNKLRQENVNRDVATILTQIIVDQDDPQLENPSKPIGPFYTEDQAKQLIEECQWVMKEDAGRGWRRVVPSPKPVSIIEKNVISKLVNSGVIVIACGGGGIPVYLDSKGEYEGIDGVIDKDYASALLAHEIGAKTLLISTGVEKVCLNFGKANQEERDHLTLNECRKFMAEKQFPGGSMGPKIGAAIWFLENRGEKVIITSIDKISAALAGKAGTLIEKD